MALIADALIFLAAATAALYCMVLAQRLKRLNRLDDGLGAAIAALSAQVGDLGAALEATRGGARAEADRLAERTQRAEAAIRRIELLMAALNDLPDPAGGGSKPRPRRTKATAGGSAGTAGGATVRRPRSGTAGDAG